MGIATLSYWGLFFCIAGFSVLAQTTPLVQFQGFGTTSDDDVFFASAEKIANTTVNKFAIDKHWLFSTGNLQVRQRYAGTTIRSSNAAFRDDWDVTAEYNRSIADKVYFTIKNFWYSVSDSRDIGLSSLQRFAPSIGTTISDSNHYKVQILTGFESNKQFDQRAVGWTGTIIADAANIRLDDILLSGSVFGDYRGLDEKRKNSDISGMMSLTANRSEDFGSLYLSGYARRQQRDFFSLVGQGVLEVEQRTESRVGASLQMATSLHRNAEASLDASIDNGVVVRRYADAVLGAVNTNVQRRLHEFQMNISTSLRYTIENFQSNIGISTSIRDETNAVEPIFSLDENDEQILRRQEFQRDNASLRYRIFADIRAQVFSKSSIIWNGWISMLRYDTPSAQNNDDRDELGLFSSCVYKAKVSDKIEFDTEIRLQYMHFVFLKSSRSGFNNWNRSIMLIPKIIISGAIVSASPRFEVLANYTTYDFESVGSLAQSFSFRQVGLRDSVIVRISEELQLDIRLFGRYFERGRLYWNSFSERPISANYEQLIKIFLVRLSGNDWSIGLGGRYYALSQRSLVPVPVGGIGVDALQQFYGPEILCSARISNNTMIRFNGWYERQFVNHSFSRELPNVFFYTTTNL